MAGIINKPRLEIEIIDETWAEIRATFEIDWNINPIDDLHRIRVEVWGDDSPLRDDRLAAADYETPTFYRLSGHDVFTITGTQRVLRALLDEDKGRGVFPRPRNRRDIDEVYVVGYLQVLSPRTSATGTRLVWTQLGDKSKKSNVISGTF
ncbi:hypothetical protein VZG28_14110 [Synechococcus elongatus IITB4]|uniref:hypothetical protein n=1 Tax=Synechococcus elongatus TaxID=32046 RepID=UPI0030CEAEB5